MKEIIIALIGGGFFVFLEFLIRRYDDKHSHLNSLHDDIKKNTESIEALRAILIKISDDNDKQGKLLDKQAEEILGLGHDKIIYLTDKIARRGCITLKEKANLKALYYPYKDLGGNGDGETGFEHCMKLNVVSDARAQQLDKEMHRELYGIKDGDK
jgi:hypothetical protein